jgi:hypothetical protein
MYVIAHPRRRWKMVGNAVLRVFLLPGNLVCDALGARKE